MTFAASLRRVPSTTLPMAMLIVVLCSSLSLSGMAQAQTATGPWVVLDDGSGPVGRWDHSLSYDPEQDQAIVFGGRDVNGTALGDTWVYGFTEASWQLVESPGPVPRFGAAVAVDHAARALYLFGGQNGPIFYNDAWRFDLDTLTWDAYAPSGALPSERYGLSGIVDGGGQFVISHGFTGEGRFNDTWSLDPETGIWMDVSPIGDENRPLRRCLHDGAFDPERGRMLMYGGCASGFGPCPLGDLWAFDPATGDWEVRSEAGPPARDNPAIVLHEDTDRLLLFGGRTDAGRTADMWAFDLASNDWEQITVAGEGPSPRSSHDAVLAGDRLILFGGMTDSGPSAGLWELDLTAIG